jgi:membrane-bound metal-dependent hydrolase YbcI (DUF457 family)
MKREGHYGTTLILGALWVLGLGLPSGLIATVLMLGATHVPDQDQYIPANIIGHRGPTHSVLFALVVAFVTASTVTYPLHVGQRLAVEHEMLSSTVMVPTMVWMFLVGVVAGSLLTHIATDALTVGGGFKVKPLWPLSSWTPALGLCTADDVRWNTALLSSGITIFVAVIVHELYYSVLPALTGL